MSLLERGQAAVLALEDGSLFAGHRFGGGNGDASGEVVFHTGMCGYPEIMTDPSYRGQIVVLTYPHAGNYGMPDGDDESGAIQLSGLIVHRLCRHSSGVRPGRTLQAAMSAAGVWGLEGVDTRAITRRLRERGSLRGRIEALPAGENPLALSETFRRAMLERVGKIPSMEGQELASQVSVEAPQLYPPQGEDRGRRVALLHLGLKSSIGEQLRRRGCHVTVWPADTPASTLLESNPHGVLLSNGPGDPAPCEAAIATVRALLGTVPVLGICLGHQVLALAAGAQTYKLPFGHHGANHPVREEENGGVAISSQNHGFAVDEDSLKGTGFQVSHRSLYDGTVEGIANPTLRAWGIQYHPEGAPGPHDARDIFDRYVDALMEMP